MPSDKNGAATAPEPQPSLYDLQAELETARARLQELHPKVEAERVQVQKREDRITVAKNRWMVENPGLPFDPDAFNPPMVSFPIDQALHRDYHRLHYVIAKLERQIATAARDNMEV